MSEQLFGRAGRRRSPATMPGFHAGRPPRNKGLRYQGQGEGGVSREHEREQWVLATMVEMQLARPVAHAGQYAGAGARRDRPGAAGDVRYRAHDGRPAVSESAAAALNPGYHARLIKQ